MIHLKSSTTFEFPCSFPLGLDSGCKPSFIRFIKGFGAQIIKLILLRTHAATAHDSFNEYPSSTIAPSAGRRIASSPAEVTKPVSPLALNRAWTSTCFVSTFEALVKLQAAWNAHVHGADCINISMLARDHSGQFTTGKALFNPLSNV